MVRNRQIELVHRIGSIIWISIKGLPNRLFIKSKPAILVVVGISALILLFGIHFVHPVHTPAPLSKQTKLSLSSTVLPVQAQENNSNGVSQPIDNLAPNDQSPPINSGQTSIIVNSTTSSSPNGSSTS